jgi:hypothetical protein
MPNDIKFATLPDVREAMLSVLIDRKHTVAPGIPMDDLVSAVIRRLQLQDEAQARSVIKGLITKNMKADARFTSDEDTTSIWYDMLEDMDDILKKMISALKTEPQGMAEEFLFQGVLNQYPREVKEDVTENSKRRFKLRSRIARIRKYGGQHGIVRPSAGVALTAYDETKDKGISGCTDCRLHDRG